MPASGSAKAVSDYEHLNSQRMKHSAFIEANDSGESEFLPLKPSKSLNKGKHGNINASNTSCRIGADGKVSLTQMLDDFAQLQDVQRVPIPMAWSPSMEHTSNPDLFITPVKAAHQSKQVDVVGKENLLETQSSSNIPVPVAWSPGMVVKPNPDLFVTPDKTWEKSKQTGQTVVSWDAATSGKDILSTRMREKPTVRFDLPSMSSGEEMLDSSGEHVHDIPAQSPIILKGCDMDDGSMQTTPSWKAFSPQKTYDPMAYSDESTLDDSSQSPTRFHSFGHGGIDSVSSANNVEESTSDRLADKLQELLHSSASDILKADLATLSMSSQPLDSTAALSHSVLPGDQMKKSSATSSNHLSSSNSLSHTSLKSKRKIKSYNLSKTETHRLQSEATQKAGPQFLKTPPSPYEPRSAGVSGAHVIRESEASPSKNNYSFPFDGGVAVGDADSENAFARPEYNSTLRVRSELDELCQQEIDVDRALAVTLNKSEAKRTELNEKASVYTNRMSNQFRNLVDLDPSVESLCTRVVRMRTSKSKGKAKELPTASSKSAKPTHTPPDLMEFLPPNLQKETPEFSSPGVKTLTPQLQSAPQDIAFDLYKHNRLWQGITDY